MLNRATALLNFADADAQFQRRNCSISPAEALNFNAVCKIVAAHELGHIILHSDKLKAAAHEDMNIYNIADKTE